MGQPGSTRENYFSRVIIAVGLELGLASITLGFDAGNITGAKNLVYFHRAFWDNMTV
jgi:hypothetical protein